MTYSYTQISQYLTCPRRYRHRYLDGWQEKDTRAAMLFGRAFEQALAAVQSAPGAEPPEEWKAWLEGLMRNPPPAIAEIVSKLQQPPAKKPTNEETEG